MPDPQPFRLAVRKFAPFEAHLQKLWAAYCAHSGCRLPAEFVALDLHPLHQPPLAAAPGTWPTSTPTGCPKPRPPAPCSTSPR